jgi:TonB family protein
MLFESTLIAIFALSDARTESDIRAVVDAARPRVMACGNQPSLGRARMTVRPSGIVARASLDTSSGSAGVDQCVLAIVRSLRFSRADEDQQIMVPFKVGP